MYAYGMKMTHLYLKARQIRQLKALGRRPDTPMAALVRRAVDEFLDRRKAEKAK
jgi:hypothetical protein